MLLYSFYVCVFQQNVCCCSRCLSQSLAQVWRSGSSSLAAPAGRRFSLQGSLPFHSLTKLTLLLSSLLSQPGCPTRKALVSSGSHQLSDSAFPGEPWHLKRKLAARVSRTCHQASESVCHSAFLLFLQGLSYLLSHSSPALAPALRDAGSFSS